jgi:glutathione S-transferase
MTPDGSITLFHSPQTRSTGAVVLMEELGVPYRLRVLNFKSGEQRTPEYRAINPMGKVPAVLHLGQLVSEQAAVYQYLADLFPEKGLAPAVGEPLRGPYLRWMVMYGSCFEPAMLGVALKHEPPPPGMCPWGDVPTLMGTLEEALARGPWLLGERFSAADLLWGLALGWMLQFGVFEPSERVKAYAQRVAERPAVKAVRERDAALMAEHVASIAH